jgi:hypothetical protein
VPSQSIFSLRTGDEQSPVEPVGTAYRSLETLTIGRVKALLTPPCFHREGFFMAEEKGVYFLRTVRTGIAVLIRDCLPRLARRCQRVANQQSSDQAAKVRKDVHVLAYVDYQQEEGVQ